MNLIGGNFSINQTIIYKKESLSDFRDFYKHNKKIINIPIFIITGIENKDKYHLLHVNHIFDKDTKFDPIDSRYIQPIVLDDTLLLDYQLKYCIDNIDDDKILRIIINIILEYLNRYSVRQELFLEYHNKMSKIVNILTEKKINIYNILKIVAYSRGLLEWIFILNNLFKESAIQDVLVANKFGRVKSNIKLNIGMPLDEKDSNEYYENHIIIKNRNYSYQFDITPLIHYEPIIPRIIQKFRTRNINYTYEFNKDNDFQFSLTKYIKEKNIRSNNIGFIVFNKNKLLLNKFYHEQNNLLIMEATNKTSQYYFNLIMANKSYLADFRLFSCIQHPNYLVYDSVLKIIRDNYLIIINDTNDNYDKIIASIKIFYWLSTTVLYFRGSAAIAEIIVSGLLKYILKNNSFNIIKKENTFPDIEAMLEPDEDYYVFIFLGQFNFNLPLLDKFKDEYIRKRNVYCNTFDGKQDECRNNSCFYYHDTHKCKIKKIDK